MKARTLMSWLRDTYFKINMGIIADIMAKAVPRQHFVRVFWNCPKISSVEWNLELSKVISMEKK